MFDYQIFLNGIATWGNFLTALENNTSPASPVATLFSFSSPMATISKPPVNIGVPDTVDILKTI